MSRGAAIRPVLRMLQPSVVRVTATCSVPICAPRTNTRNVDVFVPARNTGACWAAAIGANATSASAAQIQWRIDMASAYQAARQAAAFIDRSDRARIVVNGRDRASYL